MKVYDTDEAAVAKAARLRMLAKAITIAIMLFFSAAGIWGLMKLLDKPQHASFERTSETVLTLFEPAEMENMTIWSAELTVRAIPPGKCALYSRC